MVNTETRHIYKFGCAYKWRQIGNLLTCILDVINKYTLKLNSSHPVYTCIFHIAMDFGRSYTGWPNQDKHSKTNRNAENACLNWKCKCMSKLCCHIIVNTPKYLQTSSALSSKVVRNKQKNNSTWIFCTLSQKCI